MAEKEQHETADEPMTVPEGDGGELVAGPQDPGGAGETPVQLGSTKYVHAAFFAAAILGAFLIGRILGAVWNRLAEWPTAVRAVPGLLRYAEDERPGFTMVVGAIIALIAVVQVYRKEGTRRWADEVASELSKVVWPNRETVTNGTIVVIIASIIATVYIGLLDRFWGFVTTLVYGA
jgi:preprotein translocase subunit SecE